MCKLYIKAAAVLLAVMSLTAPALAGTYIKDLKVIGGTESEVNALKSSLGSKGWKVINKDLNAGAGGDYIYLIYLPESNDNGSNYGYVTDFYISNSKNAPDNVTHDGRNYYRVSCDGGKDFVNSKGDLNSKAGGDYIYLYYTKDSFDDYRVVTDIVFNDTKSAADAGLVRSCSIGEAISTGSIDLKLETPTADLFFAALRFKETSKDEELNFKVLGDDGVTYYGSKTIPAAYKPNGNFVSIKNTVLTERLELNLSATKVSTAL